MTASPDTRPLIAHVLFRFDVGGLENGVVNLINHLPEWKWRHTVIALDDVAPGFARRVERQDVAFHALRKPAGHLVGQYPRLVRLFRDVGPAIIHTRNLAALEATGAITYVEHENDPSQNVFLLSLCFRSLGLGGSDDAGTGE